MNKIKRWWESRTTWLSILLVLSGLPLVLEEASVALGGVAILPESWAKYILVLGGLAGLILRRLTDTPMRVTPDESDYLEYGIRPPPKQL